MLFGVCSLGIFKEPLTKPKCPGELCNIPRLLGRLAWLGGMGLMAVMICWGVMLAYLFLSKFDAIPSSEKDYSAFGLGIYGFAGAVVLVGTSVFWASALGLFAVSRFCFSLSPIQPDEE